MTLVAYSVPQIRFHKGKLKKKNGLFKILSLTTTVLSGQWMKEKIKQNWRPFNGHWQTEVQESMGE